MFDHEYFDVCAFEDVPLDRDLYLISEEFLDDYERYMLKVFGGTAPEEPVGLVGFLAARLITEQAIQLSWYANVFDRFHEVSIALPRTQFITCVGSSRYDEKPHIFVRRGWMENLYARSYAVYALVDAIDVKKALEQGTLTRDKLVSLRDEIDALARDHPDVFFISFADSLLLKSNWSLGERGSAYSPEIFLSLFHHLQSIYRRIVGLDIYCILTQGSNEYHDDEPIHISDTKNHVSLNSLGTPFAQLLAIERTVRDSIRRGDHGRFELYIDSLFFKSLRLKYEFDKRPLKRNSYPQPLGGLPGTYYASSASDVLTNLG